jgi:hypothetical protein
MLRDVLTDRAARLASYPKLLNPEIRLLCILDAGHDWAVDAHNEINRRASGKRDRWYWNCRLWQQYAAGDGGTSEPTDSATADRNYLQASGPLNPQSAGTGIPSASWKAILS